MHYNIDGTVASWDKSKPLIFGEHGPWHYVSPQSCSKFGGQTVYASFDSCQAAMGLNERMFLEYARKEEVTGVTPFNMSNYTLWTMPPTDIPLEWEDLTTPGPKPRRINAHTLTVNNGLLKDQPLINPNPSYAGLQAGFKPVTIFADQYNTSFYGGSRVARSFSIYNDTEKTAPARLIYRWVNTGGVILETGETAFNHQPGERYSWAHTFVMPEVSEPCQTTLHLDLYHADQPVHQESIVYRLCPRSWQSQPLDSHGKHIAYIGSAIGYRQIERLAPGVARLERLTTNSLWRIDMLVIGPEFVAHHIEEAQAVLDGFVARGGFVLVLEQTSFAPGELTLSGRPFICASTCLPDHPILAGLSAADLGFWAESNPHEPNPQCMIRNAFNKPVQGDFEMVLECGEGDFGWGGLLWTPLVVYTVGTGKVALCQIALTDYFDTAPQAALLLRNLLEYGLACKPVHPAITGLLAEEGSVAAQVIQAARLICHMINAGDPTDAGLVVIDPDALDEAGAVTLHAYLAQGGQAVVLPAQPRHTPLLKLLAGQEIILEDAPVYQVQAVAGNAMRGISAHDLFFIEKVTYTPPPYTNTILCQYALRLEGSECLLQSAHNPWEEYFVKGMDAEFMKVAVATKNRIAPFTPKCYAASLAVGAGQVTFIQVDLRVNNDKMQRLYTRLLANLGASFDTQLLHYVKHEQDYGFEAFMALAKEEYSDYAAMLVYFSDPNYILNNLGEGVYGWMKHLDKRDGAITVPNSTGKIYFMTTFIDSATNHDPTLRPANELPDSSIVPDLYLTANCPVAVYVNGHCFADFPAAPQGVVKIDDVVLRQGINRFLLVCHAGDANICLNTWFKSKFGEYLTDLKYHLTMD